MHIRPGNSLARAPTGSLFIDRMDKATLKKIKPELDGLVYSTRNALKKAKRRA